MFGKGNFNLGSDKLRAKRSFRAKSACWTQEEMLNIKKINLKWIINEFTCLKVKSWSFKEKMLRAPALNPICLANSQRHLSAKHEISIRLIHRLKIKILKKCHWIPRTLCYPCKMGIGVTWLTVVRPGVGVVQYTSSFTQLWTRSSPLHSLQIQGHEKKIKKKHARRWHTKLHPHSAGIRVANKSGEGSRNKHDNTRKFLHFNFQETRFAVSHKLEKIKTIPDKVPDINFRQFSWNKF